MRITTEEKSLLKEALSRARASGERSQAVGNLKALFGYHDGYVDFPKADTLLPADEATDVAVDATVSIEFDIDVTDNDLSGITIDATTEVTGITPSIAGNIVTIAHDAFANSELHTVTIPQDTVRNANGLGNKEITWSFTTIAL